MKSFIYIGEGNETDAFGYIFPNGKPVEVIEEHAINKLANNPQFKAAEIEVNHESTATCDQSDVQAGQVRSERSRRGRPAKC